MHVCVCVCVALIYCVFIVIKSLGQLMPNHVLTPLGGSRCQGFSPPSHKSTLVRKYWYSPLFPCIDFYTCLTVDALVV